MTFPIRSLALAGTIVRRAAFCTIVEYIDRGFLLRRGGGDPGRREIPVEGAPKQAS